MKLKILLIYMAIALSLTYSYITYAPADIDYSKLLEIGLNFLVTLFGFLLTAISILIGLSDRAFIQTIKTTGHYSVFLRNFLYCIIICWLNIILNILSIMLPNFYFAKLSFILLFFFIILNLLMLSLGNKFWAIIKRV